MISRITAFLIVVFWLTMTVLLIRIEVNPQESVLLQVPVEHVVKMIFMHGLDSELGIFSNEGREGTLSLRPRTLPKEQTRMLDFDGNLLFKLPLLERQRYHVDGTARMSRAFDLRQFLLRFKMTVPAYTMMAKVDQAKQLQYAVMLNSRLFESGRIPLDEHSPETLLTALNIDPAMLGQFSGGMNPPQISAQENQLHLHGESVEVYELTVKQGDLEVANIYVSQLGQILMAKTVFGYTLRAVDIEP